MEQPEPAPDKKKIKDLEQDLNDLRQGLAVVTDLYMDLETASKHQLAELEIDETIVKPLMDDELEFESILSFHEKVLVADLLSHVPCTAMYEAFVDFCTRNGIRRLAFFGSILTNRFSDSSDIDILVEFRPKQRVGFFHLAEMEAELGRILGGRRVDLRTPMDLSRHFRDDVLGTAVAVYAEP